MTVKLSNTEASVVSKILTEVNEQMEWNKDFGEYTDNGGIIICLKKDEKTALTRALKKISK